MEKIAIVSFLNQFMDEEEQLVNLRDLADGLAFQKLFSRVQVLDLRPSEIKQKPKTWQQRLSNLKVLNIRIREYQRKYFTTAPEKPDVQLLQIAKNQDQDQIIQLFERLFQIAINCANQNFFIEKIMQLELEEQELFQHKVMKYMKQQIDLSPISSPKSVKDRGLFLKLGELEEELRMVKIQNSNLEMLNEDLKRDMVNYREQSLRQTETIRSLESHMLDLKQREELCFEKSTRHSQLLVKSLEDKLTEENSIYEKKCLRLQEEISLLQNKLGKVEETEERLVEAQSRIRGLLEKISGLNDDKEELGEKILRQNDVIQTLEIRNQSLNEDVNKIEFQKISLKVDNAKSNARSSELQRMLSMSFEEKRNKPNLTETLSKAEDPFQSKYQEIKESFNISNRRVKELERDLAKANLKADKLDKVQGEKKKLSQVLIDFTNSRGEEVQLLTSALYELRCRYQTLQKRQFMQQSTLASIQCD